MLGLFNGCKHFIDGKFIKCGIAVPRSIFILVIIAKIHLVTDFITLQEIYRALFYKTKDNFNFKIINFTHQKLIKTLL
jgi:hypothetical protein